MPAILMRIPLALWVRRTVEKMNARHQDDAEAWSRSWLQTYRELGGTSQASGTKGCPRSAAYGLWRLGRIARSGQPFRDMSLVRVNTEFGKNATYAVLALDLLEQGWNVEDSEGLWAEVRRLYAEKLHETPAESQQRAVKVARILFAEGETMSGPH